MEATLNFNIPLSIDELAELIKEPSQAQLITEMKQAVYEINLVKQGKMKVPTLDEFLNEL